MNAHQKRIAECQEAYRKLHDEGYLGHSDMIAACGEVTRLNAADVMVEYKNHVIDVWA